MRIATWTAILTNFIHLFSCQTEISHIKFISFFVGLTKQNWFYLAFLLLFKPLNSQIFQFLCVRLDFPFQHKIKQFEIFAFKLFFFVFFRWKIQIKNKGMDI